MMTDAANTLIEAGYQIIVPFDADEFWHTTAEKIDRMCSTETDIAFIGQWQNFVQQRHISGPQPFGLLHIKHRAPIIADTNQENVTAFRRPFICYLESKVAFKTSSHIQLSRGQHQLIKGPRAPGRPSRISLALRYRSDLEMRIELRPRRSSYRTGPDENWQSAFHERVVIGGRVDEVWAANSAGPGGTLNFYGEPVPLVPTTGCGSSWLAPDVSHDRWRATSGAMPTMSAGGQRTRERGH
jgi:hypothetical protein